MSRLIQQRRPFLSPEGDGGGGGDEGTKLAERVTYLENEAKKAYKDRDAAKAQLKELQGKTLSDEDATLFAKLKAEATLAEEAAARKAGEFDKLREQLVTKHKTDVESRDQTIATLSTRFKNTVVRAEFGAASDLFGGSTASTVLDVDMAMAVLGSYVSVEDTDDAQGYRIVVKGRNGDVILGKDGKPAPFSEAIAELINTLPNKDRILRGSGKAGSGSSGGAGGGRDDVFDLRNIKPDQLRDPAVLEQIRKSQPRGALVMGEAYSTRK